ncbi:IclR family transcriptional regulator [Arthrobacter oryzae]|uniref:IclR family transcriptional regulator n=1 Tax=Arthrobacter oryzae TaxID=409290 RepID=UPI00273BC6E5|nr:IclR family transcriptional regulator [Arthrobacter oryzae]WLQ07752.1 IclR family transcriptional regulator [Arthrobacter oryzae]
MAIRNGEINSTGLARDIRLLELLASDRAARTNGLGVTELANLTGRSKAVVSRALATLAEAGLVSRDHATLRYSVGPRVLALAARSGSSGLVRLARPLLRSLVQATQETAHLSVLSDNSVLTLASEVSPHQVRSAAWEGVRTAAWRTPSGRVLISEWSGEELEEWFRVHWSDDIVLDAVVFPREDNPFRLLQTPSKGVDPDNRLDALHAELATIRRQGFALMDEDFEEGVIGVSAPVRDSTGAIVAALNVSGPKMRLSSRLHEVSRQTRFAAQALTDLMAAG